MHRAADRDLEILERLCSLFRERAQNPISGHYARIFPLPENPAFPPELESRLERSMAPEHLQGIRVALAEARGDLIRYIVPWSDPNLLKPHTVDWLISHAVLEHVDDLDTAYRAASKWLKPGGMMTHLWSAPLGPDR
jgi:hypothetical protein